MFAKNGYIIGEISNFTRSKLEVLKKKYGKANFIHTKSYSGAIILKVNGTFEPKGIYIGVANYNQAGRGIFLTGKIEEFGDILKEEGLEYRVTLPVLNMEGVDVSLTSKELSVFSTKYNVAIITATQKIPK